MPTTETIQFTDPIVGLTDRTYMAPGLDISISIIIKFCCMRKIPQPPCNLFIPQLYIKPHLQGAIREFVK